MDRRPCDSANLFMQSISGNFIPIALPKILSKWRARLTAPGVQAPLETRGCSLSLSLLFSLPLSLSLSLSRVPAFGERVTLRRSSRLPMQSEGASEPFCQSLARVRRSALGIDFCAARRAARADCIAPSAGRGGCLT